MYKIYQILLACLFVAEPCFSADAEEVIKQDPHRKYSATLKSKLEDPSPRSSGVARNNDKQVLTKRVRPQKISLEEYLEYGMVPVEDLEAKLAEAQPGVSKAIGVNKGKYYTVYSRGSGGDAGGADSGNSSGEEFEDMDFTADDIDEDEEDDE